MPQTRYAPTLPSRTTLRRAAARIADVASGLSIRGLAAHALVVFAAFATFAASATVTAVALAAIVAALPAHPPGLLATAAITTFALYTLPFLALRAALRVADATARW